MKIRTIVKASLALGLVTTGASIVTTQSAKAEVASALKSEQLAMKRITKRNHNYNASSERRTKSYG